MDESDTHNKACWIKAMLHMFCDICIKVIDKGMRPNTHFNKAQLKNKWDEEQTGLSLTKAQLKNKWDGIKKD
jgi:hypothetical protein